MAPLGLPTFGPGAGGGPVRVEHQPPALTHEPTTVDGQRDPVTADPLFAKLVIAGDAELLVKGAE
jgi:hypothetical protein